MVSSDMYIKSDHFLVDSASQVSGSKSTHRLITYRPVPFVLYHSYNRLLLKVPHAIKGL